jgi:hypothetical protein
MPFVCFILPVGKLRCSSVSSLASIILFATRMSSSPSGRTSTPARFVFSPLPSLPSFPPFNPSRLSPFYSLAHTHPSSDLIRCSSSRTRATSSSSRTSAVPPPPTLSFFKRRMGAPSPTPASTSTRKDPSRSSIPSGSPRPSKAFSSVSFLSLVSLFHLLSTSSDGPPSSASHIHTIFSCSFPPLHAFLLSSNTVLACGLAPVPVSLVLMLVLHFFLAFVVCHTHSCSS